jgi:4-hydroxyphenylpyruvate dioxygenase-like putative hemolysin
VAARRRRRIFFKGKVCEWLPQTFIENRQGPVTFEFIQRKMDRGLKDGNFKARFESLELGQKRRGAPEDAR